MLEFAKNLIGFLGIAAIVGSVCFFAIAFGGVGMEEFTWRP